MPPAPPPSGANEGSRWEGSTAGRAAPTGNSVQEVPRPSGAHDAGAVRPSHAPRWGARTPPTDPVGALGFTKLPTGYLHARLRREETAKFIPPKTAVNQKVGLRSLRFWLFVTAGVLSHPAGKTTLKLAVPERERDWWRRLWEKILSPLPNCNAVENHAAFTC